MVKCEWVAGGDDNGLMSPLGLVKPRAVGPMSTELVASESKLLEVMSPLGDSWLGVSHPNAILMVDGIASCSGIVKFVDVNGVKCMSSLLVCYETKGPGQGHG